MPTRRTITGRRVLRQSRPTRNRMSIQERIPPMCAPGLTRARIIEQKAPLGYGEITYIADDEMKPCSNLPTGAVLQAIICALPEPFEQKMHPGALRPPRESSLQLVLPRSSYDRMDR